MAGKRRTDFSSKTLTGIHHWSETIDWRLHKFGCIWDLPVSYLEEYGWYQIELGVEVQVPIQKMVISYEKIKKGAFDHSQYQLVKIDWDYLLERQAKFYASLHWGREEIEQYHRTQEGWLEERSAYYKDQEKLRYAQGLAEQMGMSVEQVLALISKQEEDKTEPVKAKSETSLIGSLEKLSNEFFLYVSDGNQRFKIRDKSLLLEQEPKGTKAEDLVDTRYEFEPDYNNPPKSRQSKGWVVSLTRIQ